mmetsp:Transcript_9893/g.11434  ORF Transcript_9893/g.11434 Transcript_9893/m.11434 type:complete len:98 (-) Transcript_9893:210-503(-)
METLSIKQRNGKVSLKNCIVGVDYKMTINMLMKYLYIAARYFYITNLLTSWDISRVFYEPTKTVKSNYFIQAIQGKLINLNQMELTKGNIMKSIGSK